MYHTQNIESEMDMLLNIPRPTVDEATFVRNYIPIFMNDNPDNPQIWRWVIEVAGSPYQEVDIIAGHEVVGVVPALLIQQGDAFNLSGIKISDVVSTAKLKQSIDPREGDAYLRNALLPRVEETKGDMKNALQWIALFERYGVELPEGAAKLKGILNGKRPTDDRGEIESLGDFCED